MSDSTSLTQDEKLALITEARRAPSAHNTQPARWRFSTSDGHLSLSLLGDPSRHLPHADPTGRDDRLSLGAAFEGMSLALSRRGFALTDLTLCHNETYQSLNVIASARVTPGAEDPLAIHVDNRASWRGKFGPSKSGDLEALKDAFDKEGHIIVVSDDSERATLAREADASSRSFLRQPAYFKELFHWLRFSPGHPDWNRDGLNGEAMALSGIERILASLFMRPWVFRVLGWLRLDGILTSEAGPTRSACAIALVHAPKDEDPFVTGRRFYRSWLRMESVGMSGCPLSSLADDTETAKRIARRYQIPEGHRLVNAFRVGRCPERQDLQLSARLPPNELIVEQG